MKRQRDETMAHAAPPLWIVAAVVAAAIALVYWRAIDAPFIYDDRVSIVGNASIHSVWPLVCTGGHSGALNPPRDLPTSGRPLVNLSFAVNYAIGGLNPTSYRIVNVLLHYGSALLIFAITRRTLLLPYFAGRFDTSAGWLAFVIGLVWALHPLQTEAVTYITQRTELMMAAFYLGTMYCSMRYWDAAAKTRARRRWLVLAVVACLCGMASKEVMVSAPLVALLFERTFVAGSFKAAMRRSWPLYAGLFSTWLLLLSLSFGRPHSETAGFGLGVSSYSWWLTQCKVLLMYFKLAVWPRPLLIHYEWPYFTKFADAWQYVVPVLVLGWATLLLVWYNRPLGFLGALVFAVLAPTSVVVIVTELAAERRMYLPLVAFVAVFVVGGYWIIERVRAIPPAVAGACAFGVAATCGVLSAVRLNDYHDELLLWRQVLQNQPRSSRAHGNLGSLLLADPERVEEAASELEVAASLDPRNVDALTNLGIALVHRGRSADAIDVFDSALAIRPDHASALYNLALALLSENRLPEATEKLQRAIELRPEYAEAHNALGIAFFRSGHPKEAIAAFNRALAIKPASVDAHANLGQLLASMGETTQALTHLAEAVRGKPDNAELQHNLGDQLRLAGRMKEAIEHEQTALRLKPDLVPAYFNLSQALAAEDRPAEATAAARKGIESARAAGNESMALALEAWLASYERELQRSRGSAE